MAVVFLDIHAAQDPNGSVLATLTDEDVSAFEMRCGENELGSGTFTIRRDHADATEANLATGNYVKVRIPLIQAEPVFGFWLDEHDDTLISTDEEGGEYLTRKGWGPLYIYAHARLLDEFYNGPLGGQARGNYDVPGYWTWNVEPYGAIMVRLTEEGQLQPGFPLGEVNIDWNRVLDSDGNAWPTVNEEIQFPIGTDGLTVMQRLVDSGELFLRADADLSVHGYGTRGLDLTGSAYAADVVRFVKGENILTGLERQGRGVMAATHAIVVGKDLTYRKVVAPDYVPGETGRWTTTNYGESNDTALLDKVGLEDLRKRNAEQQGLELEFFAGDDPTTGRYLPFKHFNTGDLVSLDTGAAEWDYQDAPHYVIGFRIVLGEASKDDTDEEEARSLRWVIELNAGGRYSASLPSAASGTPCTDCPPFPPRPPFVPGLRAPDFTFDICNTVSDLMAPDRHAASAFLTEDVGGDWYFEVENTQHDVAAITESMSVQWATPAADEVNILPLIGCWPAGICQGYTGVPPNDICPFTVMPSGSGTFTVPSGATGFQFRATSNGYSAPCGAPFIDECWTIRLWRGTAAPAQPPQLGQYTSESIAGTTSGTDYQTNYPYHPGSLQVWVHDSPTDPGILVISNEVDSPDGLFDLGFDATGQTLTVTYQIAAATPTGATNGQPTGTTTAPGAGVTDHGALTGLLDDDHTQYQKESEKGAASGYASLDGSTKVPIAQIPTGTTGTTVALGDHAHGALDPDAVRDAGRWEPVTDGDIDATQMVFEGGDIVMDWVPG